MLGQSIHMKSRAPILGQRFHIRVEASRTRPLLLRRLGGRGGDGGAQLEQRVGLQRGSERRERTRHPPQMLLRGSLGRHLDAHQRGRADALAGVGAMR